MPPSADADLFAPAVRDLLALGRVRLRATGGSMAPWVCHGDWVTLAPWPRGAIPTPGDVVLIETAEGALLLHRVLGVQRQVSPPLVVTRGDASAVADRAVPLECVLARLVAVEASAGVASAR